MALCLLFGNSPAAWAQPPVPQVPAAQQPAVPAAQDPEENENPAPNQNNGGLPPNFELPAAVPPVMSINKPLLKPDLATARTEFKKLSRDYSKALRNGELSGEPQQFIRDGIKFRVLSMSMPEERRNLVDLRETLMRDLRTAGVLQPNAALAEQFRRFVMNEVVSNATLLLDNQFHVRLNAILLLSQLNLKEPEKRGGVDFPAIPFAGAAKPLLEVMNDPKQLQALKIPAAVGLGTIATIRNLPAGDRQEIAQTLVKGLMDPASHSWYQMRLARALGNVELIYDRGVNQKPFIIDTLVKVMLDKKRHYVVRSEAARASGAALMNNTINASLIAYEIAQLGLEMAKAQQENPGAYYWKGCFLNLYLAFRGENEEERQRQAGLKTKLANSKIDGSHKTIIDGAYDSILPLVIDLVSNELQGGLPAAKVATLDQWLKGNKPESNKLAPSLEPITRLSTSKTDSVTAEPEAASKGS